MASSSKEIVHVWTLATGDLRLPPAIFEAEMTQQRLFELRSVLSALADQPIATLEAHPAPTSIDRKDGIALGAASPLAQHLTQLLAQTNKGATALTGAASKEVLYKMVVPSKFASAIGKGIIRPMQSKAVASGIRGSLVGASGIVGQASTAAVGVAGGTAVTIAAPLVLMAVAVAASAAVEHQRRVAIEHVTDLLEELHEHNLDEERSELDGCRDAIDKATAILLDEGKLSVSLGLDSAVHAIGKALAKADRRLDKWNAALDALPEGQLVEVDTLTESFPGIDEDGGLFRAQVELASLAIALKRRVIVLQAVEHAQMDSGNPFEAFMRELKSDQQRVNDTEAGIAGVLIKLSTIELGRPRGLRAPAFTPGQVDRLLQSVYKIQALGNGVTDDDQPTDVSIEIIRNTDGSVLVFPALAG
jgi:hypothetical protein